MGQYNDTEYAFLGSLGYTGALNDRRVKYWLDIITPPSWILATGSWSDNGAWRDLQTWSDS